MSLLNTFGQSTVGHVGHVMKSFYTAEVEAFFGMPRNLLLRVLSGAKGARGRWQIIADHSLLGIDLFKIESYLVIPPYHSGH